MEPKASPTSLSDQELLDLSLKNETTQALEHDVYLFVSTFNLQVGNNKVAADFLYSIYTRWSKRRTPKEQFLSALKELFVFERLEDKHFVLLDSSVASVTRSMLDLSGNSINNPKRVNIQSSMEQFRKEFNLVASKSWVGEVELFDLYKRWSRDNKKKTIKREDFLDSLEVLFVGRFTKSNLKEFAVTYTTKEVVEQEKTST